MSNETKYTEFSNRLIEAMQSSGYTLNHSRVSIKKLAEISGTSEQICRCYIRGVALPNYKRIILIAKSLKVSPGWLLFGTELVLF